MKIAYMYQAYMALLLALSASSAAAGSARIGAQFGASAGSVNQYTQPVDCPGEDANNVQCVQVPGQILGWSGALTVKAPYVELLAAVYCAGQVVWAAEMFKGTIPIVSPAILPPELTGPCWLEWSTNNIGASTQPNAAWEIQFTILYR